MRLLFLLVFSSELFAQIPENKIPWSEQPLSWENFEAEADPASPFDANTNSGISYSWSLRIINDDTEFQYEVASWFYPELSWVKNSEGSESLLAHEQLHFDISELYARKLKKLLAEFKISDRTSIKEELGHIYKVNEAGRTAMQKKYDAESRHGENSAAQEKWRKKISAELALFEGYSTTD